jgi:hypothetical protein
MGAVMRVARTVTPRSFLAMTDGATGTGRPSSSTGGPLLPVDWAATGPLNNPTNTAANTTRQVPDIHGHRTTVQIRIRRVAFSTGSKQRLTDYDLDQFAGEQLFDRIGRAVCHAGCLPRKELYEAWEVARRTRRLFRGGRIVDLGAGHGLLAQILMILDDTSAIAVAVDTRIPASAVKLHDALIESWPRLRDRISFEERALDAIELHAGDLVVSSHACGALTDVVLDRAIAVRARVAVLPCCHHVGGNASPDLSGWLDGALAIDVMRAVRLEREGYRVWTQTIPAAVTPKNRLLLGAPLTPLAP